MLIVTQVHRLGDCPIRAHQLQTSTAVFRSFGGRCLNTVSSISPGRLWLIETSQPGIVAGSSKGASVWIKASLFATTFPNTFFGHPLPGCPALSKMAPCFLFQRSFEGLRSH